LDLWLGTGHVLLQGPMGPLPQGVHRRLRTLKAQL